jgi:NTE family protein
MEIDTLVLSGGGINCLGMVGSLKYLQENDLIKKNFSNIKTIIGVSGGIFNIIPFLLKYSYEGILKVVFNYDCEKIVDLEKFTINDMLLDYGVLKNVCSTIVESMLVHKGLSKDITLKDFYEYTNIELILKVVNLNKNNIVFASYKNFPELKLTTACDMTSCIPFVFKPIKYKDEYYVDGALCGNFPIEHCSSKNYLGINIDHNIPDITDIQDIGGFVKSLWNMIGRANESNEKRIINIKIKMLGTKFNVNDEEKKMIIRDGYKQTIEHFSNYSL